MYKAYCDGKLMYDPRSKDLALMNPELDLALNSAGSFSFTMPLGHPFYDAVKRVTSVVTVLRDGVEVFAGRVMEQSEDFFKQRTIYVEGELAYLNDSIQRPAAYEGTPEAFLKAVIGIHNGQVEEGKRFTVGRVTVTGNAARYSNYENTWKTLKDALISQLGGYIFIRKENGVRYIDYLAELPNTSSQVIDFGLNLLDYSSNMDVSDIVTAVIPLGHQLVSTDPNLTNRLTIASVNNGVDIIRSEAAISQYGFICKVKVWDDVTMAQPLKEKGEYWLQNTQWEKMQLDVTAVDLHDLNADAEALNLGDNVRVYSEPHGLDRYFPVYALNIKLDSPADNVITMGFTSDDLSDRLDDMETSISGVQQNVERTVVRLEETEDSIEAEVSRATEAEGSLSSKITQTANAITSEVSRATQAEGTLFSQISQTAQAITSKVSAGEVCSIISQSAEQITIQGNRLLINSDNFNVWLNGTIESSNGIFSKATFKDGLYYRLNYNGTNLDYPVIMVTSPGQVTFGVSGMHTNVPGTFQVSNLLYMGAVSADNIVATRGYVASVQSALQAQIDALK